MAILKEKLDAFESQLRQEKKRLEEDNEITLADTEFGDSPGVDNEAADETEELINEVGAARIIEKYIEQIDDALAKIAEGTYGICEECGRDIELAVLEAAPESRLCQECKKKGI